MKNSLILYHSYRVFFEKLSADDCKRLVLAMIDYDKEGIVPDFSDNVALDMVWISVVREIDENTRKYEKICNRNRINGLNGGRLNNPTKPNETQENPKNPVGYLGTQKTQDNPTKPKKPDDDDVDVDDDDDVDEKKKKREKKEKCTAKVNFAPKSTFENGISENGLGDAGENIPNLTQNRTETGENIQDGQLLQHGQKSPLETLKIDFGKLRDFWNERCPRLSPLKIITAKRQELVTSIVREYGKSALFNAIIKAGESDFLAGHNQRGWSASFDWMLNKNNFIKVLEGNYSNNEKTQENGTNNTKRLATAGEFRTRL